MFSSKTGQPREHERVHVKRLEVADAIVLYSLVLIMLKDDPMTSPFGGRFDDPFKPHPRTMFESATSMDPRYKSKGWVENKRMYPKPIEDVYMNSGFSQTSDVGQMNSNKYEFERFPMDSMEAILASID